MEMSFDVKITANDLYKFNLKNAYKGMQGIISLVCPVVIIAVLIWKWSVIVTMPIYIVAFLALAILFIIYIPINLWLRTKQSFANNKVYSDALHYEVNEEQITISALALPEEDAVSVTWDQIFRVKSNKSQLLIYTNRYNAWIIPKNQIEDIEKDLKSLIKDKVEGFKIDGNL